MGEQLRPVQVVDDDDLVNHAAGTAYYPSAGISLSGTSVFTVGITAADCTVSVEQTIDGVTWIDVTDYLEDIGPGLGGVGGPVTFVGSTSYQWQSWFIFGDRLRVKVVYPNDTNAVSIMVGRRSL